MFRFPTLMTAIILTTTPALAQAPAAPSDAKAPTTSNAGAGLPGVTATTGNPNLSVATIKLDHGTRMTQVIGKDVFGSDGKELGKVDDLVMTNDNQITLAVISVGGFLGVGNKLVAFPFGDLKHDGNRLMLPEMTADKLSGMPSFQY